MLSGDTIIDGLLAGDAAVNPLGPGASGPAIGNLHDLLRGHGYPWLPDARAPYYTAFASATSRAIFDYRRTHALPPAGHADSPFLRDLISSPAPKGAIGPAYVPLVLDVPFTPIHRFIWLTSLFETGGAFQTLNLNTDGCGLSFGILQWSQKAGQLHRILAACHDNEPAEWQRIMQDDSVLDHAKDPAFDLTVDPWRHRLEALGASLPMQRVQLDVAAATYQAEFDRIHTFAPEISQRAAAFLLDLANQFGAPRVEQHYKDAAKPGIPEPQILKSMQDAFVAIASPRFRPQVEARRQFFRTTPLL